MLTRRQLLAATAAVAATCPLRQAAAQVGGNVARIYNGFPAGSSADGVSRLLAAKLNAAGSNYIVENRTGAGGRLAVEATKNAPADGQSLLVTPDAIMMLYPHTYKSLNYDPVNDFRAVTTLSVVPVTLTVGPMVPDSVTTLADFARWCKANPQSSAFGTSGPGSTLHFIGVMFARATGIELAHVSYRGGNLAAQDVASGQIASCVTVLSDVYGLVQGGKLRVLGISSPQRWPMTAQAPTFTEQGFKDLESLTWYGIFAPAKTPEARIVELQNIAARAFEQPDAAVALGAFAMEPRTMTSDQFAALLKADIARWGAVVKQLNYVSTD